MSDDDDGVFSAGKGLCASACACLLDGLLRQRMEEGVLAGAHDYKHCCCGGPQSQAGSPVPLLARDVLFASLEDGYLQDLVERRRPMGSVGVLFCECGCGCC